MHHIFLAKTIIQRDGSTENFRHACILVGHKKEGGDDNRAEDKKQPKDSFKWDVIDEQGNNVQIKGATTRFIRNEIYCGRIQAEPGWDN